MWAAASAITSRPFETQGSCTATTMSLVYFVGGTVDRRTPCKMPRLAEAERGHCATHVRDGSKCEELNVIKSSPPWLTERTSMGRSLLR